jgi:hypothetical protein
MQRRCHPSDLAVGRDKQTRVPRLDRRFGDAERLKVLGLLEAPEQRREREPEETEPTGPVREVEAEFAGIQTGAGSEIEAGHLILIVADEEKCCAAIQLPLLHGDA